MLSKSHFIWLAITGVTVAVFIATPKPQLLQNEKANIVSEAVYWEGFGTSGTLSDANASFVKLDKDTDHLHICYGTPSDISNCQIYKVVRNKGFVAALFHSLR